MKKRPDSGITGILVVDKPAGFTSFDVVAKLRGICGTRRIGHGGTLDPMATGVLPIFLGGAAKAVDLQPQQDKAYEAELLFGIATDTGDITGEVLRRDEQCNISRQRLETALAAFCGTITQLPPLYSAVKVNGKPMYKYAREGKPVERKPRQITIHEIQYLGEAGQNRHRIWVHCSKGTYVRSLAEDLGEALGVPATLNALRRTQAGSFTLEQCYTLDEIQQAKDEGRLEALLLSTEQVFSALPALSLNEGQERRMRNGAPAYGIEAAPGRYRVSGPSGFLGLAQIGEDGYLRIEKLFVKNSAEG